MPLHDEDIDRYSKAGSFSEESRAKESTSDVSKALKANLVFCAKSGLLKRDLNNETGAPMNIQQYAAFAVDADGDPLFTTLIPLCDEWGKFFAGHKHPVTLYIKPLDLPKDLNPSEFIRYLKNLFDGKLDTFSDADESLRPVGLKSRRQREVEDAADLASRQPADLTGLNTLIPDPIAPPLPSSVKVY